MTAVRKQRKGKRHEVKTKGPWSIFFSANKIDEPERLFIKDGFITCKTESLILAEQEQRPSERMQR